MVRVKCFWGQLLEIYLNEFPYDPDQSLIKTINQWLIEQGAEYNRDALVFKNDRDATMFVLKYMGSQCSTIHPLN